MSHTERLKSLVALARRLGTQVSYTIIRVADQDGLLRSLPGSAEYGIAQLQAPMAVNTGELDVPSHSAMLPDTARGLLLEDERECIRGILKVLIIYIWKKLDLRTRRLDEGDFEAPTQIMTTITITDPVDGDTVYPLNVTVATNGEGIALVEPTSTQLNEAGTGLCDNCILSVVAGECLSGDCEAYDMEATNEANQDPQASVRAVAVLSVFSMMYTAYYSSDRCAAPTCNVTGETSK